MADNMIKQGDYYKAKQPLTIGRCKPKQGDLFWVTSPFYTNTDHVVIARKGKKAVDGYRISVIQLLEFFEKVEIK
jgi:hypothetical protein